jgi:hypothetical protein
MAMYIGETKNRSERYGYVEFPEPNGFKYL